MNLDELIKTQIRDKNAIVKVGDEYVDENEVVDGQIIQLVSFQLDDVEYGIDILIVHEILRMQDMTRLPNTPNYIKGVINLRGNVIPVVDMRVRFGLQPGQITELTRIIVVETDGKQMGMLVDNVSQVIRLNEKNIDPPSDLIEGVSEEFISGVGRLEDKLLIIMNLEHMLFNDEEEESY